MNIHKAITFRLKKKKKKQLLKISAVLINIWIPVQHTVTFSSFTLKLQYRDAQETGT